MSIKYEIHSIKNSNGKGEERHYAHLHEGTAMNADQLESHIEESCSLTKSDMEATLSALRAAMIRELSQGKRFHLPSIGSFSLSVDLNLPEVSGFQICRDIKRRSALPVLVLTSRDQMRDEVHALELGADEYLTKPYRKERLLARIGNVLKRYEGRPNLLEGADFLLDRQTYTLYIHNQSVVLPPNQGKLLETLLAHGGQTVTKDDLSRALWGTTEFIDENALQVNLTRLKKTMASLGMRQQLVSVRGVGYRLEVPHEA